ncbi:MAG: DUF1573 domain-containing protein [Pirellulaceae bacterium]
MKRTTFWGSHCEVIKTSGTFSLALALSNQNVVCQGQDRRIRVNDDALAKMRTLGEVNLTRPNVVDLGDLFAGESLEGKIALTNDMGRAVTIKTVKASCGCTAAHPDIEHFDPGSTHHLLITFNTQNLGSQSVILTIDTGEFRFPVKLKANVRRRIQIRDQTVRYTSDQESLPIQLDVIDKSIPMQQVRVDHSRGQIRPHKIVNRSIIFHVPIKYVEHNQQLTIYPVVAGERYGVIPILPLLKDQLNPARTFVYGEVLDSGEFKFRLLVTGDLDNFPEKGNATLNGNKVAFEANVTNGAAVIHFVAPSFNSIEGKSRIEIADRKIQVRLLKK